MPMSYDESWYNKQSLEHGDLSKEVDDVFNSHAIVSGFTWTAGMAHYLGYWQDEDITTPITTQLINTGIT